MKKQIKLSSQDQLPSVVGAQKGGRILVERAKRRSTADVHAALFPAASAGGTPANTLDKLKQGVRQRMQRRHVGP